MPSEACGRHPGKVHARCVQLRARLRICFGRKNAHLRFQPRQHRVDRAGQQCDAFPGKFRMKPCGFCIRCSRFCRRGIRLLPPEQPQPLFHRKNAPEGSFDARLWDAPAFHGALKRIRSMGNGFKRMGDGEHIAPGFHSADGRLTRVIERGERAHFHTICKHQPGKAEGLPEQAGDGARRERARHVLPALKRAADKVCRHYARIHAKARNARGEGRPFGSLQRGAGRIVHGQANVGINRNIPVPGEVLEHGKHAPRAQAFRHCKAAGGDRPGRITIGAHANDGVLRLAVHIEHRCKVHVHAKSAQRAACTPPYFPDGGNIASRSGMGRETSPPAAAWVAAASAIAPGKASDLSCARSTAPPS